MVTVAETGRRLESRNPAQLDDVVAEITLEDAAGFAAACRAAREARRKWERVPAPALGEALVALFHAGGVPREVLRLVQADGQATFGGLERALDEGVLDKVGFTGSSDVGREIGALCGRHLQSPCLELGGKNPLVVMDDAELDLAVEGALFSGFGTAGQRCTSLGTAIVHERVHDEFLERFTAAVAAAPVG